MSAGYAVGESSWYFAGTRTIGDIVGRIGIADHHVVELPVAVGHIGLYNACSER